MKRRIITAQEGTKTFRTSPLPYPTSIRDEVPEYSLQPNGYALPEVTVTGKRPPFIELLTNSFTDSRGKIRTEEFNTYGGDFGTDSGRTIYMTPQGNDTIYFGRDPDRGPLFMEGPKVPNNVTYSGPSLQLVPKFKGNQEAYKQRFYQRAKDAYGLSKDASSTLQRIQQEQ